MFSRVHLTAQVRLVANRKLSPLEGIKPIKKVVGTLRNVRDGSLAK